MNRYAMMGLTGLVSAVIIGGGYYVAIPSTVPITIREVSVAIVMGLVAAAKAVNDLMTEPPP